MGKGEIEPIKLNKGWARTPEERAVIEGGGPVFSLIRRRLAERLQALERDLLKDDFDTASWAEKKAYQIGNVKQLKAVLEDLPDYGD